MKALRRFFKRLAAPATRRRDEERLQGEVEQYIALQTAENQRAGLSHQEARRQAVLKFGAVEAIKEEYREQRGLPFFETLLHDTRHSFRRLRKSPVFTLAATLTLALGIGATTAIFTLVHAVMLKSLPVSNPDQLFRVGKTAKCCVYGGYSQNDEFSLVSYPLYKYFRDHTSGFDEMAAFQTDGTFLGVRRAGDSHEADSFYGRFVSGNYFQMFGVSAYAGRALTAADDRPAAPPAAVMSYRVWQQKYGSDPSVIGGAFSINHQPFTVVGVTPPGFYGDRLSNSPPDFYLPLASEPQMKGGSSLLEASDINWLSIIGRAGLGVHPAAIEAQMRVELQQWLKSHWGDMEPYDRKALPRQTLFLAPGGAGITLMRQQYADWLQILMMVSGFVLLIVCANVANLMLVRGIEQRSQVSLSMALGARPSRIVRQALSESVLLSLLGGAAGLAVAFAATRLILYFTFRDSGLVPISAAPSLPILLFALGISLLTGIIFGIAPAWMAMRVDPIEALRGAHRATRHVGSRSRRALVVVQAALSLALLSASGLLTEALLKQQHQDLGFQQDGRVLISIDPVLAGYKPEQLDLLYRRIHDTFGGIPDVASVASALYTPLSGDSWTEGMYIEGRPSPEHDDNGAAWARVSPGFFNIIDNPIVEGRPIGDQDTASSRHVAVINQAFAHKFFKKEDPIGKHFGKGAAKFAGDYEIVGVAKNARYLNYNLDQPVGAFFFLPAFQSSTYNISVDDSTELRSHYLRDIIVRMRPGTTLSEPVARRALASVDPNLPLMRIRTLSEQVLGTFSQQRLIARLTSLFGVLALILASIGIYGITAYNVGSRTNEIGVRMALGAGRRHVLTLILRGALLLIALGLALGVPLSVGAGKFLGSQLYGINPYDPRIIAAAVLALAAAGITAALIPAMNASAIAPVRALRSE